MMMRTSCLHIYPADTYLYQVWYAFHLAVSPTLTSTSQKSNQNSFLMK